MPSLCLGCKVTRKNRWFTLLLTVIMNRGLPWSLTIARRRSSSSNQTINCSFLTSITCGVGKLVTNSPIYKWRHNNPNCTYLLKIISQSCALESFIPNIHGSLKIFHSIPEKLQDTNQSFFQMHKIRLTR